MLSHAPASSTTTVQAPCNCRDKHSSPPHAHLLGRAAFCLRRHKLGETASWRRRGCQQQGLHMGQGRACVVRLRSNTPWMRRLQVAQPAAAAAQSSAIAVPTSACSSPGRRQRPLPGSSAAGWHGVPTSRPRAAAAGCRAAGRRPAGGRGRGGRWTAASGRAGRAASQDLRRQCGQGREP